MNQFFRCLNISNSNIYHGIDIEGSASVNCYNNVVTKNSPNTGRGVGIFYGGGTSGTAAQNDISGWDWGIGAIWGASINSQNPSYPDRNNRIRNCNVGLVFYHDSYGYLGAPGSSYGANSIYNNTTNVAVGTSYTSYPSGIDAMENWWGSNPPNTSLFSVGPNAYFNYSPFLSSDPWAGLTKAGNNITTASVEKSSSIIANIVSSEKDSLLLGIELRLNKKNKEAKDIFISFIAKHPDNQQAYVELYNCYSPETADDIINFFTSLPSKASKSHTLLLGYLYLKQGKTKTAQKINNEIIKENPNSSLSSRALINNTYIALYNENNLNEAISIFRKVLEKPELATQMELIQVQDAIKTYANSFGKEISNFPVIPIALSKKTSIPDNYELLDNFPNPFNPTTTIHFGLPKNGFVILKIYDILGKEVATLVNEQKAAGSYDVKFNAENLSSGIYIYQLKVNDFIANKKLILMK